MSNTIRFQKQKLPGSCPDPVGSSHLIAADVIEVVESAIWKEDRDVHGGKTFPVRVNMGAFFPTRDFFTVFVESKCRLTCREVRAAAKEVLYHFTKTMGRVKVYATYYNKMNCDKGYTVDITIDFLNCLETINSAFDFWVSTPKIGAIGCFEPTQDLYSRYCDFANKKYATCFGSVMLASKSEFVATLRNIGVCADENQVSHWITGDL
jgi:hypothetical protein